MAATSRTRAAGQAFAFDVLGVLFVWLVLLALENLVIDGVYNAEFSGSWEMAHARWGLSPVAIAALVPAAVLVAGLGHAIARGKVRWVLVLAALSGLLVGYGVSFGRHFASLAVRVPFVLVVAASTAGLTALVLARRPRDERVLAILGSLAAAALWSADARVLPRLYPAFHAALFVATLLAAATPWLVLRRSHRAPYLAAASGVLVAICLVRAPSGARQVATDDNLRRVLVEHAPLLGRAVRIAGIWAPPPALDDDGSNDEATRALLTTVGTTRTSDGPARALEWSGRDVVLLTVDALRADHVSSYGYGRTTTPNMDALAARGARFSHAYCPTPHTSYSVTSLMTGKYMRPLLAMGAGEDSETWADYLRHYGYRTAAFYPPAIFFIDAHRFTSLRDRSLGFEYKKEEFAKPELRRAQIEHYLARARKDKPLFLWLHVFEPHEPYEAHPEHPFSGDPRVDAYDSEIAAADALLGDVVRMVEARRPGAVVIFSADHGEEFDDHGGRYHGSSVYEEQVRVPLVIAGPGVEPRVVDVPVQTIDLLPTTLAAQGIPLPARLRGRDLGPLLLGEAPATEEGLAFSETDDYTLVARGHDRLVCERRAAACSLFDVQRDPGEKTPVADRPDRVRELRKLTAVIERENGKHEASKLPEALRRGLQGDRDAAEDVLPLFDDARVDIRRAAAQCAFRLRAPVMFPQLERARGNDEDEVVRRWASLALVRLDPSDPAKAQGATALLSTDDVELRRAAALALAERGDGRGEEVLTQRWSQAFGVDANEPGEEQEGRELLAAFGRIRAKSAVAPLARSLATDVRLRPFIATALAEIGDPRAKKPLLEIFTSERYLHVRPREAEALLKLGAREELRAPLERFAGVEDPMDEAIALAGAAGLLAPRYGGYTDASAPGALRFEATLQGSGPARLWVRTSSDGPAPPTASVAGHTATAVRRAGAWMFELPEDPGTKAAVTVEASGGVAAAWLVRRAPEIPPPPPEEWRPDVDGGADDLLDDGGL